MCRFNLSAPELRATILEPWAQDRWIEFGERKWSPHQAKLTVLEGPRIPVAQLTMGRGWRAAQHAGREVTDELLAALGQELQRARDAELASAPPGSEPESDVPAGARGGRAPSASSDDRRAEDLAADSLGLELLARITVGPAPLRLAWEIAGERYQGSPPSAALALAERAVQSLLRARLIVLLGPRAAAPGKASQGEEGLARVDGGPARGVPALDAGEAERAIAAIGSWSEPGSGEGPWMRRA